MANSKKKPTLNSTRRTGKSVKVPLERKSKAPQKKRDVPTPVPVPCTGCCSCVGVAGGAIFYCEDDTCVAIAMPTYLGYLVCDPSRLPANPYYWERV